MRPRGAFDLPVEVEILKEKAGALGRTGERIEASLARLTELRSLIESVPAPERAPLVRLFDAERARAEQLRYYLVVQREAIGMRRHAEVDRAFPLPPRMRAE